MNDKYCIWVVFEIENFEKGPLSIFDKKSTFELLSSLNY
jgi:hypothetical protein